MPLSSFVSLERRNTTDSRSAPKSAAVPLSLGGAESRPVLAALLIALLVAGPLPAQNPANAAPLTIAVVNNDGGVSAPGARAQRGFALQISDNSGAPVADAAVVLRFPDSGPTATFADGTHAGVAYTDATGRAEVSGMQWSTESGTVPIKVTATKGTAHAGTIIEEQVTAQVQPAPIQTPAPSKDVPAAAEAMPVERAQAQPPALPGVPRTPDRVPALLAASSSAPSEESRSTTDSRSAPKSAEVPLSHGGADSRPVLASISVINRPSNDKLDSGGGHKKWIILLIAVAAGAGAGIALAGKKGSSSSTSASTSTGTTIGSRP